VARAEPFTIDVNDADLDDLRERLARTRWPPVLHGGGWKLGTDPSYLRQLLEYWSSTFDWRAAERRLNSHPQFRLGVDGTSIHFVHLTPTGNAHQPRRPILLLHGWPYSFAELLDLADRLASGETADAEGRESFEVIVPSLPGYVFSEAPDRPFFWRDVPRMLVDLMATLGHDRFIAHGSDVGAQLTNSLAVEFPDRLLGIHLTQTTVAERGDRPLTPAEQRMLAEDERWEREDAAYTFVQETRPQTLAAALSDSPAGLAAWIVEKLHEWTDLEPHGDLERVWSKDRILTLLTLYWTTGSIGTSFLSYYEAVQDPHPREWHPVRVPAGFTIFARDLSPPPREWADRGYANIVRWTDVAHGGHFPAVENVDLLAEEIRSAASRFE
jgi:pimeloyl-ACP methyl ester carboxylesterase